ncbi:hypothetical protein PGTUg99_030722 [Puccinia graminis f. sp. tritici]|uniref:Uncharacterized protein n=1 Tax=Puccinia graminis f. sp. tritici TaxID=56615 RepID=A0A5B0RK66_PUCGR|nr:hypothetical protein PGTUg99_030722 [Puccinia graminis f. sp. tritici]
MHSYQHSPVKSQQHPIIQADMDEYKRFATLHGYEGNQQTEHFEVVSKAVGDNASFNQPHLTLNIIVDASSWDVLSSPIFPFTVMPEITGDLCPTHIDCKFRALPIGSNNVLSGRVGEIAQD